MMKGNFVDANFEKIAHKFLSKFTNFRRKQEIYYEEISNSQKET